MRRRGGRLCRDTAAEAYQCGFHIVKQTGERAVGRVLAGNEDVIHSREAGYGKCHSHCLPEAAAGPVADHGTPNLFCGGEPCSGGRPGLGPAAGLDDQGLFAFGGAIRDI
jgi:hypothetical protein